jgi:hypothetical protein
MSRSVLAHAMPAFASSPEKKGQSCSISASSPRPNCSRAASSAVPSPYHAGSTTRAWVQEKTQGIARKSSIRADRRRLAGREPSWRREISCTGVTAWKKALKSGSP